jgi:site-specific recombinase XerD
MSKRRELDPFVETYLGYLEDVSRKTRRTVADVRCSLRRVADAVSRRRPGVPLWKLSLEDYLRWMEQAREAGASDGTLAKTLSHLRGLLDYAWRTGRADRNVLDGFQVQDSTRRTPPRVLSLDEAERLVKACPRGTAPERRNRLIVLLLYGCGLRTKELCGLRVQDVDASRRELHIREGKGDRERVVPVPPMVHAELLEFLRERGAERGALFRTDTKRTAIRPRHVVEVVRDAAQRAGLAGPVTPRTLRQTCAAHLLDVGVGVGAISAYLGRRTLWDPGVSRHAD